MTSVRVISYNILSDALATPKTYPHASVADLKPSVRMERILARLLHRSSEAGERLDPLAFDVDAGDIVDHVGGVGAATGSLLAAAASLIAFLAQHVAQLQLAPYAFLAR